MYDWVTHTHSHIGGECNHRCGYCYVRSTKKRSHDANERYSGELRLIEGSLDVDYGRDRVIFIDHMNDLFASGVLGEMIVGVLNHCRKFPENKYVFQTKNPKRYIGFRSQIPVGSVLGTTIESNRRYECMGDSPTIFSRVLGMGQVNEFLADPFETFITIEPILDFDVSEFVDMIEYASPTFVNIGADSKRNGLPEPTYEKVLELYDALVERKIEVRKKLNLDRLAKGSE